MLTICVFLALGFEEIEALTPVDVLRRAGMNVLTVSISNEKKVISAHNVPIEADILFKDLDKENVEMIVLPGGMPGATNLDACKGLSELLIEFAKEKKPISAICAAPLILGKRGILEGKKATCYPGFEKFLEGAHYTASLVEKDGNIITGKGPGAALEFAFAIVEKYKGIDKVKELKEQMMIKQ